MTGLGVGRGGGLRKVATVSNPGATGLERFSRKISGHTQDGVCVSCAEPNTNGSGKNA